MLGQSSKDSVRSTTCQFKATLSRLGDGQRVAEVAGVHLGVPDYLLLHGQHADFLALVQARGYKGFWQGGDHSMVEMVTRWDTTFPDTPGMSDFA